MKILYVITQADGGGAQKYTLQLAKYFGGTIAAGSEAEDLFLEAEKIGVKTFRLKYLKRNINLYWDFLAFWELVNLIRLEKPDVVHLNSTKAGFTGSFAARFAGKCKVIFTAHGFRFNEPFSIIEKQIYKDLERLASMFRDYVIAVSEADMASATKANIIPENKISVIHNGIGPIDFFDQNSARIKLGLPHDKFIFGTIAGCYSSKGLDILIDAVGRLNKTILEKCLFAIIGSGPEFENSKLKIKNLNLETHIKLLGKINNANTYLKGFNAFILPSRKEGFPYTLLEAMQAGLSIIATDVGGNKEALGSSAILIEPQKPEALVSAISQLYQNPQLQKSLSERAKSRSSIFSEQKMLEQTNRVYENIIQS